MSPDKVGRVGDGVFSKKEADMLPQQKDLIRPGLGLVKDQEKRCGKWKDKRLRRRDRKEKKREVDHEARW